MIKIKKSFCKYIHIYIYIYIYVCVCLFITDRFLCLYYIELDYFFQSIIHTFIYSFIYLYISSSISCRAPSTDIPDTLSPLYPILHRLSQVFRATSRILTQLLYVCSNWLSCFSSAISGGPQEYITYELVSASPAVSCMSGSSNLDSFRELVPGRVLPPWLIQYCSQHSCVIAVQLFLQSFSQRQSGASINQYRHVHCLEETAFHFIGQVLFSFDRQLIDSIYIYIYICRLYKFNIIPYDMVNIYLCLFMSACIYIYIYIYIILVMSDLIFLTLKL